jgi:nucleoside-diphosphate-sugar epimerase
MRVLIAGAGYVGTQLGLRLVQRGATVFALRRNPSGLPAPLRGVRADLAVPETLEQLPRDLTAVAYTAGADETSDAAYERAYAAGLRHLLAALDQQQLSPHRIVFTSSTAVYAQQDGEWVDEETPAEATHFTGARVLEGERILRASGRPHVTLRLGGIYGPGRARLIDAVRRGEATYPPGPIRYVNRNHRDDCAAALEHLLDLSAPDHVYLGADGNPADQRTVVEWLANELGAPPPRARATPPNPRRASSNKRCRSDRLRASGFRFAYPSFREGYASLFEP